MCQSNVLTQQNLYTYFAERPPSADTEPLSWYKAITACYPTMSELAKQLLCISPMSVPAEHIISAAGYIVSSIVSRKCRCLTITKAKYCRFGKFHCKKLCKAYTSMKLKHTGLFTMTIYF